MPVLHISIEKPTQTINLTNHIISQNLRLTKVIIVNNGHHLTDHADHFLGNIEIQVGNFLMSNEFLSNTTAGRIPVPNIRHYGSTSQLKTHVLDYDISFKTENIPHIFEVKTFGYKDGASRTANSIALLPSLINSGHFASNSSAGNVLEGESTQGMTMPVLIDLFFDYETNDTFF